MKKALVGYTGFVGSNICAQTEFDAVYNSGNIDEAYGTRPDLLVFAGVRAEKYLANNEPERDLELMHEAALNINKIAPKRIVLISTIDVYKTPCGVDEDSEIIMDGLHAYGKNRRALEQMVSNEYDACHIIRLPGLFGKNIKKNFIYDLINIIPSNLNEKLYLELSSKSEPISKHYTKQPNGFYRCGYSNNEEKNALLDEFRRIGFSALNFTDSRAMFQFYDLSRIWGDIETIIDNSLPLVNMAVEPVRVADIYSAVAGGEFENHLTAPVPSYDFKTKYASLFGGRQGYIENSADVMGSITRFIKEGSK